MSEDGTNPPLFVDAPIASEVPTNLSPGAQLAEYRQARGWTVAEVADQLNLAPRQIQAIEADNHAALPGLAVTRGFVRAYAKLMKVDATALLAGMVSEPVRADAGKPQRRTLSPTNFSDNRLTSASNHKSSSKWYSLLVITLVVIGLGAAADYLGWLPDSLASMTSQLTARLASFGGAKGGAPVSQPATPATPEGETGLVQVLPAAPISTSADVVTSAAKPALVPGGLPSVALPASLSAAAQPGNLLVLTFRKDSWVELKGRGKNGVAAKLYRAGTVETFPISEPVQLLVGNAAGVDASLRGVPLSLPSSTKNNVARLQLK